MFLWIIVDVKKDNCLNIIAILNALILIMRIIMLTRFLICYDTGALTNENWKHIYTEIRMTINSVCFENSKDFFVVIWTILSVCWEVV